MSRNNDAPHDIYEEIINAYRYGDLDTAENKISSAIENSPDSLRGRLLRYMRARAYEFGWFATGEDMHKAYVDYRYLEKYTNELGSDVLVGAARSLFNKNGLENVEEIRRLCETAINLDKNIYAYMVLGLLYDKVINDQDVAKQYYRLAFFNGLPWGMRYVAHIHKRLKHYIRYILCSIVATIASPFLVMIFGPRGPFSGSVAPPRKRE